MFNSVPIEELNRSSGFGEIGSDVEILHEGWVEKWTNYMSNWKYRYLYLYADGLLAYGTVKGGPIKGKIKIGHATITLHANDSSRIDITTADNNNFFFRTNSSNQRNLWFSALKNSRDFVCNYDVNRRYTSNANVTKEAEEIFDFNAEIVKSRRNTYLSTLKEISNFISEKQSEDILFQKRGAEIASMDDNIAPSISGSSSRERQAENSAFSHSPEMFTVLSSQYTKGTESSPRSQQNISNELLHVHTTGLKKVPVESLKENIEACKQHVLSAVAEVQRLQSKFITDLGKITPRQKVLRNDIFQLVTKVDFLEQIILSHLNTTHRLAHDEARERSVLESKNALLSAKCEYLEKQSGLVYPEEYIRRESAFQNVFPSSIFHEDGKYSLNDEKEKVEVNIPPSDVANVDTTSNLEFFDCEDSDDSSEVTRTLIEKAQSYIDGEDDINPNNGIDSLTAPDDVNNDTATTKGFRKKLPIAPNTMKSRIWSVLKHYIGSDLSMGNITMPVCFNEPTSLLQRIAEDFQYESLLKKANKFSNSVDRLAWICVFAASPYASACGRTFKPFNPLLGETYEMDHRGFKFLAEQVSHHPPITAYHVAGDGYEAWGHLGVQVRLKGKSLEVFMPGDAHVLLNGVSRKDHFVFHRAKMLVHNIFFGDLWIEMEGKTIVRNLETGDFGILEFFTKGWFNSTLHKVKGLVFDKDLKPCYLITGTWSKDIYMQKLENGIPDMFVGISGLQFRNEVEAYNATLCANNNLSVKSEGASDANLSKGNNKNAKVAGLTDLKVEWSAFEKRTEEKVLVWSVTLRPPDSKDYFGFGYFTIELNQVPPYAGENPVKDGIMPNTDSRFRPDQRAYEDGDLDKAVSEKLRLESKQRTKAKIRNAESKEHEPRWFLLTKDESTQEDIWLYKGNYWEIKNTRRFPEFADDIF